MWLTRRLAGMNGVRLHSGRVGEGGGSVQGERLFERPEQVQPYGFSSVAEAGRQAVMLDGYCAGIASAPDSRLQAGETRLYSAGGAEIYLDNTGRVVINGQVFEPKEE